MDKYIRVNGDVLYQMNPILYQDIVDNVSQMSYADNFDKITIEYVQITKYNKSISSKGMLCEPNKIGINECNYQWLIDRKFINDIFSIHQTLIRDDKLNQIL